MREFLISAYEWLVCFSEAVVVFLLFKIKLKCEKPKLYFALGLLPVMAALTIAMNQLSLPWVAVAVINAFVHIVYAFFLFGGSPAMKCIWGVVPSMIFCISNYVYLIIFYVITDIGNSSVIPGSTIRMVGRLIYMALNFGILLPLLAIRHDEGELPAFLSAGSIVLSLIGIAVSMYCFSGLVSPEASRSSAAPWIQCSAILVLCIAILLLSGYLSRLYHKHLEMQKDLQKTKLEAEHVSQVSAMYDYVRGWRHDIKGMVATVSSLAERGEYEDMKKYLNELNGAADETKLIVSTGHPAIDATLSAKLMLADKMNIEVIHTVSVPEEIAFDSTDICSIIMNLMDNAIEASAMLPKADRAIELSVIMQNNMLKLNVINSCVGDYEFDGDKLITTKEDADIHGIGLERVKKITDKYNGFFKMEPGEHSFEATVLLPMGD